MIIGGRELTSEALTMQRGNVGTGRDGDFSAVATPLREVLRGGQGVGKI